MLCWNTSTTTTSMSTRKSTATETTWRAPAEQHISGWGGWPDDVQATLRRWNKQGKLSFLRLKNVGMVNGVRYFICSKCEEPTKCHPNGDAVFHAHGVRWRGLRGDHVDRGELLCEGCLIDIARAGR